MVWKYLAPLIANGSTMWRGYEPWLPFYRYELFVILFGVLMLFSGAMWCLTLFGSKSMKSVFVNSFAILGGSTVALDVLEVIVGTESRFPEVVFGVWLILTVVFYVLIIGLLRYIKARWFPPDVVEDIDPDLGGEMGNVSLEDVEADEESPR